jgi:hypothetical protein
MLLTIVLPAPVLAANARAKPPSKPQSVIHEDYLPATIDELVRDLSRGR